MENDNRSDNVGEGELFREPRSLTDSDRLVWLMDHVCRGEVPGLGIPAGLTRQQHLIVFRSGIDAQILREIRA